MNTFFIIEGGEHWFHTKEQMRFLDRWMKEETVTFEKVKVE